MAVQLYVFRHFVPGTSSCGGGGGGGGGGRGGHVNDSLEN